MASSTTPAAPGTHTPGGTIIPLPSTGTGGVSGGTGASGSGGTVPAGCIAGASATTFNVPNGVNLPRFNGKDWANWSGTMEAILVLYEADDVICYDACPTGVDVDDWAQVHRRAKAYLCLYIEPHIYSNIASEVEYPTFKDKWDVLKCLYGGATGSTAIFNTVHGLNSSKPA